MIENLFDGNVLEAIKRIDLTYVYEIRLRKDCPIIISYENKNFYLTSSGVSETVSNSIICNLKVIENVLKQASEMSMHSINDELVNGYITIKGGVRIGVAGETVYINGGVKTIKNITSLNIRIPHEVKNCSLGGYIYLTKNNSPLNSLILSQAGMGKTTFIRDFAKQILQRNQNLNVLIVDERNEITGMYYGVSNLGLQNADVICNCKKKFAFENGIRSLKPDVIITDEINLYNDLFAIENAISSGVKVIATIHASSIEDLKLKQPFKEILEKKYFDRFLVLGKSQGVGTIESIYDSNLRCMGV